MPTNPKIHLTYDERMVMVKFEEDVLITEDDLKKIYSFAERKSEGKRYAILFDAIGSFDITDEAVDFMLSNPHNHQVLAKAYVLRTRESALKMKFHLLIDKPELQPFTFENRVDAQTFLREKIMADDHEMKKSSVRK